MVLAFRLTPLTLLGALAAAVWAALPRRLRAPLEGRQPRFTVAMLLAYSVLFVAFMSISSKKLDRYILSSFPTLDLAAGVGVVWLVQVLWRWLGGLLRRRPAVGAAARAGLFAAALVAQLALVAPHYPYYLTFYNPLLGGIREAVRVILVGWGEGFEQAAAYLNAQPGADQLKVCATTDNVFSWPFVGQARRMSRFAVWDDDYLVFYLPHVQRRQTNRVLVEFIDNPSVQPVYVVRLHGVDYAWVYRNDQHTLAPLAYLEAHARPAEGDCLLVNGGSRFAKDYTGLMPVLGFTAQWVLQDWSYMYPTPEQLTGLLDTLPPACQRLWYARYTEWEPESYLGVLAARGTLLETTSYPHMELRLYELAGAQSGSRVPAAGGRLSAARITPGNAEVGP